MRDLSIKVVVTGPDFFYREEHEWRGLDGLASKWFEQQERKLEAFIVKTLNDKAGGDLTVTLDMARDGVSEKPTVLTSVNRKDIAAFQRVWNKAADELIGYAEAK